MMRKQKLLGCINKVYALVEGRGSSESVWKPMSQNRWTVGVRSKRTYGNLLHIGGQWVAGKNVLS